MSDKIKVITITSIPYSDQDIKLQNKIDTWLETLKFEIKIKETRIKNIDSMVMMTIVYCEK